MLYWFYTKATWLTNPAVIQAIFEVKNVYEKKKGVHYHRDKFRQFMKNINFVMGRSDLEVVNVKKIAEIIRPHYESAYGIHHK